MKKVLYACIDQVLLFDSAEELDKMESDLQRKKRQYSIKSVKYLENGQCEVRIKKQYNNNEFLESR